MSEIDDTAILGYVDVEIAVCHLDTFVALLKINVGDAVILVSILIGHDYIQQICAGQTQLVLVLLQIFHGDFQWIAAFRSTQEKSLPRFPWGFPFN